jgi:hypothetical protein
MANGIELGVERVNKVLERETGESIGDIEEISGKNW